MPVSDGLDAFLQWLRMIENHTRMAEEDEQHWNDATQDILHRLELDATTYHERAKLATMLVQIRRKRREAKTYRETTADVVQWIRENESTINGLIRLLGQLRKNEKTIRYRTYHNRTDILETEGDI